MCVGFLGSAHLADVLNTSRERQNSAVDMLIKALVLNLLMDSLRGFFKFNRAEGYLFLCCYYQCDSRCAIGASCF